MVVPFLACAVSQGWRLLISRKRPSTRGVRSLTAARRSFEKLRKAEAKMASRKRGPAGSEAEGQHLRCAFSHEDNKGHFDPSSLEVRHRGPDGISRAAQAARLRRQPN